MWWPSTPRRVNTSPRRRSSGTGGSILAMREAMLARSGISGHSTSRTDGFCGISMWCRRPVRARRPGRARPTKCAPAGACTVLTRSIRRMAASMHPRAIRALISHATIGRETICTRARLFASMHAPALCARITSSKRTMFTTGISRRVRSSSRHAAGTRWWPWAQRTATCTVWTASSRRWPIRWR